MCICMMSDDGEMHLGDERALAARDDDHRVSRVGGEREEILVDLDGEWLHVLEGFELDERAEQTEDDQSPLGVLVCFDHRGQRQRGWVVEREDLVLLLLRLQLCHEVLCPILDRELGDVLGHELVPLDTLFFGHV